MPRVLSMHQAAEAVGREHGNETIHTEGATPEAAS